MTSNEVTKFRDSLPATADQQTWTEHQRAMMEAAGLVFHDTRAGKSTFAPMAVVEKFAHTCERTGLDPLARQIYCIGRWTQHGVQWAMQTSIDGFRVIAERHGQYAGQRPPEWYTEKGEWVDVFIAGVHGAHPLAARVTVLRHDWVEPLSAIATWDGYVQTFRDQPSGRWANDGAGMLAKCAEALALRKAFPQDLSGLLTSDEAAAAASTDAADEAARPAGRERVAERGGTARLRGAIAEPVELPTEPVAGGSDDDPWATEPPAAAPGSAAPADEVIDAELVDEGDQGTLDVDTPVAPAGADTADTVAELAHDLELSSAALMMVIRRTLDAKPPVPKLDELTPDQLTRVADALRARIAEEA